jgi:hypothetical protein
MQKNVCINEVRNFPEIKEILKKCDGFGRSWGRKGSCFYGSHIVFIKGRTIVLVHQSREKGSKLHIANFTAESETSPDSALKNEIIAALAKYEIIPEEG